MGLHRIEFAGLEALVNFGRTLGGDSSSSIIEACKRAGAMPIGDTFAATARATGELAGGVMENASGEAWDKRTELWQYARTPKANQSEASSAETGEILQ